MHYLCISGALEQTRSPNGFRRRDLLEPLAELLGLKSEEMTAGQLTYDLRRLRLHGIIERVSKTHRYRLTATGLRVALFFSRTYARLLRPNVARIMPAVQGESTRIRRVFAQLDQEIAHCCQEARLAA